MAKFLDYPGLSEVADRVNKKLRILTEMPLTSTLNDIVIYNGATTADYTQGSIYLYTIVETYYKWADATTTYFTKTPTPAVGDVVYTDTTGTESGFLVEAYDAENNKITINSLVYNRAAAGDVNIKKWVCKGDTTILLNGENKTKDVAEFYAPVDSGHSGQVPLSNGPSNAPTWASFAGYCPYVEDDNLIFYCGILPEVEGNTMIFNIDD